MRIHRIEIQNIASLKGRHCVDFDEFQNDHGSFAITGDTGSGKSTILNCVSLALYGKSYKGLVQGDFVTLGESSGKIELAFSCGGAKYLSVWGCRVRKKNGEYLKTPSLTKEFYRLGRDGAKEVLETSPEDIVHLSFDQFCKTVILNQGEFARFLTSSFRERKDILEKLYDGEKLDVFNPLLRKKISDFAAEAAKIEARIQGLSSGVETDVDEESAQELERNLNEMKTEREGLDRIRSHLRDTLDLAAKSRETKEKLALLEEKIQKEIAALNETHQRKEEFQTRRLRFLGLRKDLLPRLHQALERKKALARLNEKIPALKESSKKALEDKNRAGEKLLGVQELLEGEKKKISALEDHALFKTILESDIELARSLFQSQKEETARNESSKGLEEHYAKELERLEEEQKSAQATLSEVVAKQEKIKDLGAIGRTNNLEQTRDSLRALKERADFHIKDAGQIKRELESEEKRLQQTLERTCVLEEQKRQQELSLEALKDALKTLKLEGARILCVEQSLESNECVVCSNKELSHLNLKAIEKSQEKIQKYERELERVENDRAAVSSSLERSRAAQSALAAAVAKGKEKLSALKGGFLSTNYELLAKLNLDNNKENFQDLCQGIAQALKRAEQEVEKAKSAESEMIALNEQEKSLREIRESGIQKKKGLFLSLQKVRKEISESANRKKELEKSFQELAGLNDFSQAQSFIDLQLEWTRRQNEKENAQKDLEGQRDRMRLIKAREKECAEALKEASKEMEILERQLKEATKGKDPQEELENLEMEAEVYEVKAKNLDEEIKDLEVEKSALFSRKQTQQEQLKDQQNLLLVHWAAFKEEPLAPALEEKNPSLAETLSRLAKRDSPGEIEPLALALEMTEQELTQATERLEKAKVALTETKTLLARAQSAREQIKELRKELDKSQSLKEQWEELHLLIGKDEFRNYILAMVEKLLIQQTNAELAKLCDGRYLIQHKQSSLKLAPDFYIIDKFKGEETRKVSTLSGGETFMVSLAMALALAELTRGNADIESFFIDEGFGTLDQDSLEEALDMLQDIETRGKQIGLISHVKELTQRIPVNIHLTKNRLGNSSVKIVYN